MKKCILASYASLLITCDVIANSVPGNIKTETGFVVTPLLDLGLKYDDNLYSEAQDTSVSTIMTIDPSVNVLLEDGANRYSLDLKVFTGFYDNDSTDNYIDTYIDLNTHLEPNTRNRLNFNVNANWITEPRGTGLSEGQGNAIDEPVRFAEQTLEGIYEYGAKSAFGRVAARLKYNAKTYLNFTDVTQFRDIEQFLIGSKFIYNTQSGSDAFLEITHENVDYKKTQLGLASRDSKDSRALFGFAWDTTALTSGSLKVGYQNKDFDDEQRGRFEGLSWQANLSWAPLTYSNFDFTSSKAAVDPLTEGNYIEELTVGLNWNHEWSTLLSSRVSFTFMDEQYVGVSRSDKTLSYRVSIGYQALRWIKFNLFTDVTDKQSTNDALTYDKNTVGINVNLSM